MSMRPDRPSRAEWRWVLVLVGLALALRVGFVLFEQPGFYFEDSLDYDRAARAFLETGHFDARYYRFPLYPLVLAASYGMFGPTLTPLRIIQAIFGAGMCLCIGVLGRRLFGIRAGLLALFGAAVFPVHVVLAGIEYPVVIGTFLIWWVLALVKGDKAGTVSDTIRLILAGVGVALSAMLFEGGWVLALFLCLWIFFGQTARSVGLRALAIGGLTSLVVLAPWLYGMMKSGDYRALILRPGIHLPAAPVGNFSQLLYAAGFSALLVIAAIGALVALRTVPGSGLLLAWPVALGVCYAPFFTQMRYRIPADPAFILLGAYALELTLKRSLWGEVLGSLKALWQGWKRIAEKIAVVQTFVLLLLLFVVGLGPISLLMKLFRKDPMHAPRSPGSFWALRERTRERMEECLKQF